MPVQAADASSSPAGMAATCATPADLKTPPSEHAGTSCARGTGSAFEVKEPSSLARDEVAVVAPPGMHRIKDVALLAIFTALCGNPTLDCAAMAQCMSMIKFLRYCGYSEDDVCAVLAYTSKYFSDIYGKLGARMGATEAGNIMVAQAYIAHSFLLDETCPLSYWHRHLCGGYCELAVLDTAIIRVMKLRKFKLRLDDKEMWFRYSVLIRAATSAS